MKKVAQKKPIKKEETRKEDQKKASKRIVSDENDFSLKRKKCGNKKLSQEECHVIDHPQVMESRKKCLEKLKKNFLTLKDFAEINPIQKEENRTHENVSKEGPSRKLKIYAKKNHLKKNTKKGIPQKKIKIKS